jgi:hypothetical protein
MMQKVQPLDICENLNELRMRVFVKHEVAMMSPRDTNQLWYMHLRDIMDIKTTDESDLVSSYPNRMSSSKSYEAK